MRVSDKTLAFLTICWPYTWKRFVLASLRATAIPAMVFKCGPPWRPGMMALLILLPKSLFFLRPRLVTKIMAPRGPRRVLWVVVVIMWA